MGLCLCRTMPEQEGERRRFYFRQPSLTLATAKQL